MKPKFIISYTITGGNHTRRASYACENIGSVLLSICESYQPGVVSGLSIKPYKKWRVKA